MKKLKVFEAEYNGQPTYLIGIGDGDKPIKAIWHVVDGIPVWTNHLPACWHTPIKLEAERLLKELTTTDS